MPPRRPAAPHRPPHPAPGTRRAARAGATRVGAGLAGATLVGATLVGAALVALALPAAAHAQRRSAESGARADSARADSVRRGLRALPTVTVTATRTTTTALRLPLAVTTIGTPTLRGVGGIGVEEALARVPGVLAQSRSGTGDVRIVIRGFGARGAGDRSNSGTTRGVRVLLDGFPETEPDGRTALDNLDLAAAERIEVVRSNASSAWGNASGGVVNVVSVPAIDAPVVEAQSVVGGFGLQRWIARTATPVAGGRGVAWGTLTNSSFAGWRANSDARRAVLNGGVSGRVGEHTRLGVFVAAADNLFRIPGPLTRTQLDADPTQANATYLARGERRWNRTARLGVSAEHALGEGSGLSAMLYVNPKYLQRSERNTYRDFTRYHVGGNLLGHATVAHGTLGDLALRSRVTAGTDVAYQDGAVLFYTLSPTQGRGTTLTENKGEGAQNVGVFVQDELAVGDRLTLLVGARWDRIGYYYRSFLPNPPVRSDARTFARVTPKLGASWLVGRGQSVYANAGGGIEVPAGNETDPTPGAAPALLNPLLDPIRSTTYEVGWKGMGTTRRGVALSGDVALYDIGVTNEIVPYAAGRYYLTAGRARRRGVEVGASADSRAGLFASVALTLSDNRYARYVVDSAVVAPTDPTKVGRVADYSGNRIVGVPATIGNVEVGTVLPGTRGLRLRAGVEHAGSFRADDANRVRVPGYAVVNLTLEAREPLASVRGLGVRGFVGVRNLADRRYVGSAFLNPDLVNGAPAAFEPGMPRALVASLTVGRLR